MTEGSFPPRERTLVEVIDAAGGLADLEAAIAQMRAIVEISNHDLAAFRGNDVADAAAMLGALGRTNENLQAALQALAAAHARLHGFGRLVLRDLGAASAALLRIAKPASDAKN